jgi:hypothetical protein
MLFPLFLLALRDVTELVPFPKNAFWLLIEQVRQNLVRREVSVPCSASQNAHLVNFIQRCLLQPAPQNIPGVHDLAFGYP